MITKYYGFSLKSLNVIHMSGFVRYYANQLKQLFGENQYNALFGHVHPSDKAVEFHGARIHKLVHDVSGLKLTLQESVKTIPYFNHYEIIDSVGDLIAMVMYGETGIPFTLYKTGNKEMIIYQPNYVWEMTPQEKSLTSYVQLYMLMQKWVDWLGITDSIEPVAMYVKEANV